MRRALLSGVTVLGMAALFYASPAGAEERELGGVRLGVKAVSLLTRPGFGQPDFIGPLGMTVGARTGTPAAGGAPGAQGGGMPGGPGGMGGRGRGRPGGFGGGVQGALPGGPQLARGASYRVELTQFGGVGDEMPMGRRRGPGGGGGGPAGTPGVPSRAGSQNQVTTLYWLYQRPAGALLVLTLDAKGFVNSITLNGSIPFSSGRTSKGVSLGTDYMAVIGRYGYPDQAVTNGATLELTYVDHGVRFLLDGMRVNQITIGSYVAAAKARIPTSAASPRGPTGPGLGLDELKGYM